MFTQSHLAIETWNTNAAPVVKAFAIGTSLAPTLVAGGVHVFDSLESSVFNTQAFSWEHTAGLKQFLNDLNPTMEKVKQAVELNEKNKFLHQLWKTAFREDMSAHEFGKDFEKFMAHSPLAKESDAEVLKRFGEGFLRHCQKEKVDLGIFTQGTGIQVDNVHQFEVEDLASNANQVLNNIKEKFPEVVTKPAEFRSQIVTLVSAALSAGQVWVYTNTQAAQEWKAAHIDLYKAHMEDFVLTLEAKAKVFRRDLAIMWKKLDGDRANDELPKMLAQICHRETHLAHLFKDEKMVVLKDQRGKLEQLKEWRFRNGLMTACLTGVMILITVHSIHQWLSISDEHKTRAFRISWWTNAVVLLFFLGLASYTCKIIYDMDESRLETQIDDIIKDSEGAIRVEVQRALKFLEESLKHSEL